MRNGCGIIIGLVIVAALVIALGIGGLALGNAVLNRPVQPTVEPPKCNVKVSPENGDYSYDYLYGQSEYKDLNDGVHLIGCTKDGKAFDVMTGKMGTTLTPPPTGTLTPPPTVVEKTQTPRPKATEMGCDVVVNEKGDHKWFPAGVQFVNERIFDWIVSGKCVHGEMKYDPGMIQMTATPSSTAVPATAVQQKLSPVLEESTSVPATAAPTSDKPTFSVSGVPDKVDPKVVLKAEGKDAFGNDFKNTIGLGSNMVFAEPGSLLVGPDFPKAQLDAAKGHAAYISPLTQQLLGTETFSANTAESAFTWTTAAKITVQAGNYTISVDGPANHNWFVVIRGLFEGPGDRNTTTKFSGYKPGHAQVMWYPVGAYISEGNFKQVAQLSHSGGNNCGNGEGGCKGLSVIMLDLNTGAYDVIEQADTNAAWTFVASNWFSKQ